MDDNFEIVNVARKEHAKKGSAEELAFEKSRKDELVGLMNDGTFIPIPQSNIRTPTRIIGSRFVDALKIVGDKLKQKSRLFAENYTNDGARKIPTKSPTVQ